MIHTLSKIFMNYGESNWTVGVLIGFLMITACIILFAIGICSKGKLNIALIGLMLIIIGAIILIISSVNCENDNTKNINEAIRKEYEDASFIKRDNKFTSNNITYIYYVKNRKIVVYPLVDNANIKIIE
jgi:hypothetical protein